MNDVEKDLLATPGHWVLGLVATNRSLTPILVEHVQATNDVIDTELMDEIFWWYAEYAHLGVDLTPVNSYLEEGLMSDRASVREAITVFLERVRSAERVSGDEDRTTSMLKALPSVIRDFGLQ